MLLWCTSVKEQSAAQVLQEDGEIESDEPAAWRSEHHSTDELLFRTHKSKKEHLTLQLRPRKGEIR